MQIDPGPLQWVLAVVAALFCGVVAYKSFDYVRDDLRRRRENRASPPDGPGDGANPGG